MAENETAGNNHAIPAVLPILPVRNVVIFPGMALPLGIGRDSSLKLVEEALLGKGMIGAMTQKDPAAEAPGPEGLPGVGTVCRIVRFLKPPSGAQMIIAQGLVRFRPRSFVGRDPYLSAEIEQLPDAAEKTREIEARAVGVRKLALRVVELSPSIPDELGAAIQSISDPGLLIDLIAGTLNLETAKKQEILETLDLNERFALVTRLLTDQLDLLELSDRIQAQVKSSIDKSQREFYLREQMRAIQKELGEADESKREAEEIREKIARAKLPPEAEKEALRQLGRMSQMTAASPEYSVVRTWLEWILDLPWSVQTEDHLDLAAARAILDEDHYDLPKVKERIVEYLAVRKLKPDARGPILCFVGPPGTGKTSLGQSIARALGRRFVRISLGGIRDEAEIRGHRRTYVGALPGRIVQGMRKAASRNPVFMLDEVDKIGLDFRGDPSSALLEVLDPEQNHSFSDHYLEVPFDLSRAMFIATANVLEPIPAPLRDRMEVLELPGYTEEEKVAIARTHLIPRQLQAHGLSPRDLSLTPPALHRIISSYTREAGLRNLEREIAAVCRSVARAVAEGKPGQAKIGPADLGRLLGPIRFFPDLAERTAPPGVATGLAWTPAGGEIIFIEATRMPGKGNLVLTGSLGAVMKESAQAALSYIRSQGERLELPPDFFSASDIHIHVPAGAIPKDGPSAGMAIFAALASLFSNRPVRSDVAMTGEITLRGLALPVGGIKEKALAARRAGIAEVVLPEKNRKDLAEIPPASRRRLRFRFVRRMEDALPIVLCPKARQKAEVRRQKARNV